MRPRPGRTVALVVIAAVGLLGIAGVASGLWGVLATSEASRFQASADAVPWEEAIVVPTVAPRPTPSPTFDVTSRSTTDPLSTWVIVNKQHPIDPGFEPPDLVDVDGARLRAAVEPDLRAMIDAAGADGARLVVRSGYRSHAEQTAVRKQIESRRGFAHAERYSARPGFSEHQTGLALDMDSGTEPGCNLQTCFTRTAEGLWLAQNAWQYGFVVRYTEANTAVTGYAPEGWHLRWVGRELTAHLNERAIGSLEEAFAVTGGAEYLER